MGEPQGPPPIGDQRRGDANTHDARRPAEGRDRAACAAQAAATARLTGVSGCGNWAMTARHPAAAACTAVARQWVDPVAPTVTNTVPRAASLNRNSSARTLLPPYRVEERSSRFSA